MNEVDLIGETIIISEIGFYDQTNVRLKSDIQREVLWVMNHTIHHIDHIKLIAGYLDIKLTDFIDLSPSTATYNRSVSSG